MNQAQAALVMTMLSQILAEVSVSKLLRVLWRIMSFVWLVLAGIALFR